MNRLKIFICENYHSEFQKVIDDNNFNDVVVTPFPCICADPKNIKHASLLLKDSALNTEDTIAICSNYCEILKLLPDKNSFKTYKSNHCSNHLANEGLINYIVSKGGYVIALGWLNKWKEHLDNQGFDRHTAIQFYNDFCKELIFFDAGINSKAENSLIELSNYLELPYLIIPTDLDMIRYLLNSIVYEWRLHSKSKEYTENLSSIQAQSAEYSAILDLIGKLSVYTSKRDVVEIMKEIFTMILGAQDFRFNILNQGENYSEKDYIDTTCSEGTSYKLDKEKNEFCIKINHNDRIFGSLHVGNFLFPQYIEKYLNFAIEITRISGLVLSNIEQYESLKKSENEFEYLSFHDALTGSYNRAYLNTILDTIKNYTSCVVFSFDIDKLKYVNDTYGHSEGDKLICNSSNILKSCFRESDTFARIGGDEFIAILPDCNISMAKMIKNRIVESIDKYNKDLKESHLNISISIGYAISDKKEYSIESLIQEADKLMYADKSSKKNHSHHS